LLNKRRYTRRPGADDDKGRFEARLGKIAKSQAAFQTKLRLFNADQYRERHAP